MSFTVWYFLKIDYYDTFGIPKYQSCFNHGSTIVVPWHRLTMACFWSNHHYYFFAVKTAVKPTVVPIKRPTSQRHDATLRRSRRFHRRLYLMSTTTVQSLAVGIAVAVYDEKSSEIRRKTKDGKNKEWERWVSDLRRRRYTAALFIRLITASELACVCPPTGSHLIYPFVLTLLRTAAAVQWQLSVIMFTGFGLERKDA